MRDTRKGGLAESAETPKELFDKCEGDSRLADRDTYDRALSVLVDTVTFPDQLFGQEPPLDSDPPVGDRNRGKLRWIIHQASRYRDLVQWLEQYSGQEQRWLLLAIWLKEEGICEPINFLPSEVWEKLTNEKRNSLQISISDLQHHSRIEAWKPYFEQLLKDRSRIEKESRDPERDLELAGYTVEAINAARNKRRAIPAVCEWLADYLHIDAGTLRNAHSRISSKAKSQVS